MITANKYFRDTFGHKMYKASIAIDVTCPNRDGSKGTGGCIFCSEGGSGEFAAGGGNSVTEQIKKAIEQVKEKAGKDAGYIAYFQSFTSTYCSAGYLENVLSEASSCEGIEAVSVATRPDCLGPEILEVLSRQAKKMPLFVELGLQTSSDATAEFINRCYKTEEYTEAVKALKEIGANVITHIIFGLPGETKDMMMDTVRTSVDAGSDGYKFTCLYVLENTYLEKLWRENQVEILEMEEYFDIVEEAVKLLPEDAVVHRFTGDGPKKILLAPEWTKNKRQVVNYINRRFGL
ncbi:MAG: TIGR01212 family radical SAM protein [Clostridiales bacterium]|jgi:radical SAM protein (TIGR01212 family)|nr:TIGR01212 family radical SAM protein [Clostridiales bacterium]MBR6987821.1 TIGR01212 family radical SAM protein [Clostridiales bacterium]